MTDVSNMLDGLAEKRLLETLMDATPQRAPRRSACWPS